MPNILALWGVPRGTATAFEWMVRARGDLRCTHEPFGHAWHQGESPLWPRFTRGNTSIHGLTVESALIALEAQSQRQPMFVKDCPLYISHMWDTSMLSLFAHSFLIREPLKALASFHRVAPDFHEIEVGYAEQRALFDLVHEATGSPPCTIDSDDLLDTPKLIVTAWNDAMGLPFNPDAFTWNPNEFGSTLWRRNEGYNTKLRLSTGLAHQNQSPFTLADLPEHLQAVYFRIKPHYDHMLQYTLKG